MRSTALIALVTLAPAAAWAAAPTYKDTSSIACSRFTAEWQTPAGMKFRKPIADYVYRKAGDNGASLGNECNVSEYVAVVCQEKGGTVGDAVAELLRRQAKDVEPPTGKAKCD